MPLPIGVVIFQPFLLAAEPVQWRGSQSINPRIPMRFSWKGVLPQEAALYLMAFLMQLGMGIMAPVLPEVKSTFGVSTAEVSMTISAFGLARLALDLPTGALVDRVRPFWLFLAGTFVIAAGGVVGWWAPSFPAVIAARGLMGAGSAVCLMTSQYTLSRVATPGNRGRVLGMYQSAMLAGMSFSPAIGGAVAVAAGWRSSFLFCTFAGLLALASVVVTQRSGHVAAPLASTGKARAVTDPEQKLNRQAVTSIMVADVVTVALFVHASGFGNTIVPLIGGVQLGLDAATIGVAITLGTALRFVMSILGGELSDRHGRRAVLVPGLGLLALGSLGFNLVDDLPTYFGMLLFMALGRFGNSLPTTIIVDHAPPRYWGRAMGTNRFIGDMGIVIGPVTLGWLADAYGYGAATYATTGLVLFALLMCIVFLRDAPRVKMMPRPGAQGS
jgi:MFS family permease